MIKEFNNLEEIQKYYNKETNTYIFIEDNEYIDLVIFNFNLEINSGINARNINANNINASDINANNINAGDIRARNIYAYDINACDINARNINAKNIDYYGVCFAYENIKCKSIESRRHNHKHFVLDGVLEIEENE